MNATPIYAIEAAKPKIDALPIADQKGDKYTGWRAGFSNKGGTCACAYGETPAEAIEKAIALVGKSRPNELTVSGGMYSNGFWTHRFDIGGKGTGDPSVRIPLK